MIPVEERSADRHGVTQPSALQRGRGRPREPLLRGADAARALEVAQRLFAASLARFAADGAPPESIGRFGGAVFVAESLARAGCTSADSVRAVLRDALVFAPDRLSLFDGAGGLLAALNAVDPNRESFGGPRARLRAALAESLLEPRRPDLSRPDTYDLIAGVAGRAVALGEAEPEVQRALRAYAHAFADEVERRVAADGSNLAESVNLGVAHGVPGVLAALNAALPHDRELGRRYAEILLASSHLAGGAHRWGAVWRRDEHPSPRRAWCYQTVGVAAVLADRARLDGDEDLREVAAGALRAVLDDPAHERWDAALCHGRSGVASIAWRFADDARIAADAERLARAVLDEFDESVPFGYRTFDARSGALDDRPSFLDGALGIAQFLVDAATAQERRWLPLFGLLPD